MKKILYSAGLLFLCTSCATIFGGSKARITVTNEEVNVPVDLTVDGKTKHDVYLPAKVKVKRGFKPSTITASAEGYESGSVQVDKKFNGKTLWNLFLGGIPGFAVDAATGAMMKPEFNSYHIPMQSRSNYVMRDETPTPVVVRIEQPVQERVTRDNAGETSLESTIIRWYFDSAPQGARVFWRVVSNIPDEVKNTNELWLGTTPFEETRSFNIQGLTYENATGVQIEIKIRRKGYIDQSKRFNVRQAIDQQEISSFFDLIPMEE